MRNNQKLKLLLVVLFHKFFVSFGWGVNPTDYYDSNLSRENLQRVISNHTALPYASSSKTDTSDALVELDADPQASDHVILIYSRRSEPATNFGITSGWNREHLWPNSYGLDKVNPAYSDLHNLRAADWSVNSSRSNLFYDTSDETDEKYKNPAHSEAPNATRDSNSWQPPPEVRGDVARAAFYMDLRYAGTKSNENDLWLTNETSRIDSDDNFFGKLDTLLQWHTEDPVDDFERRRNELIYSKYQGNRNPFIDHPEWAEIIYAPENREQPPPHEEFSKGIDEVKKNPSLYGLFSSEDLKAAEQRALALILSNPNAYGLTKLDIDKKTSRLPHTNGWYYQPSWGWLWTSPETFPYVYRSANEPEKAGWLYFSEKSSPPHFYDYASETWISPKT